ncbi:MAG: cupin domain-containing protein [Planctomycetes bacterium]|nr:cupin domain-containing protein [Planctomycetota bacterium]
MKTSGCVLSFAAILAIAGCQTPSKQENSGAPKDVLAGRIEGLQVETLKSSAVALADGVEVVVSRVRVPPDTRIPKHYHPGEEFVYVLEGSGTLWLKDGGETAVARGQVHMVPLKAVHTFASGPDGATLLVFRVHEKGKPVRYEVGEDR